MRTFECRCGGTLFFHSVQCVACKAVTAMCPSCRCNSSISESDKGELTCDACSAPLEHCENRTEHAVCNEGIVAGDAEPLCRYCSLNDFIPDLSVSGQLKKWRLLERAKHRVLYDVDSIGLPILREASDDGPELIFDFKAASIKPVSTGHFEGRITIDIAEADSVRRERTRVHFGEPQRTLVGHFRHELGHYFWEVCVNPNLLDDYRQLFGDERIPKYEDAQIDYYASGPKKDWRSSFISAYATMHSWEDFAETFNAYLDMIAVVGTASHFPQLHMEIDDADFNALLDNYRNVGFVANEFNRDIGLLDLVPEVFTPPVIEKLRFVHSLRDGFT